MENKSKKLMEEIPEKVLSLLYFMRLIDDIEVPYDEYVKRYNLIAVDNVIYYTPDCDDWRVEEYMKTPVYGVARKYIPDAIYEDGVIIKNRYGHHC